MRALLELVSNEPSPINTPPAWRQQAYGTILCEKCHCIDRSNFPKPIDVILTGKPERRIEGGIWWTGINIFSVQFIDMIRKHLSRFVTGKCFDTAGNVIADYVTCYSKDYFVVRGNKESRYKSCDKCNTMRPIGWHGPQYVLNECLTDELVYMDADSSIFLDKRLVTELDLSKWADMELKPIAVRDKPTDGQVLN